MAIFTPFKNLYKWAITDSKRESMEGFRDNAQKIDDAFKELDSELSYLDVNVRQKKYGAKGNGTTSDSFAFQTAMNLAKTLGGVRIKIPNGTYRMTSELRLYPNTQFICGPNVKIVRDHPGYLMINGFRSTESTPTTAGAYDGVGNLRIKGGLWDGNGVAQPSKASIFHLGHGAGFRIENATFKDCANSHHIEFNACKDIWVKNSSFLGWVGTVDTFNEAIQFDLAKPPTATIGQADNTVCKNAWIEDCYFGKSGTPGSSGIGRAVGSHACTINRWHENINILNNTVEESQSFAFRAYSWKNFKIDGNHMINCPYGINVRTPITADPEDTKNELGVQTNASQICEGFSVSGNRFEGGGTGGRYIEIYGETTGRNFDGEVNFNIIKGKGLAAQHGIYIVYSDFITMMGNHINGIYGGNSVNAITLVNSQDCTLSTNKIRDIKGNGIHVSDNSHNVEIIANTVKQVGVNSVYVATNINVASVIANILIGCNGNLAGAANNFIRMTSTVTGVNIANNICRNFGSSHVATVAMELTSTVKEVIRNGNNFKGFTVVDASVNGATPADLI